MNCAVLSLVGYKTVASHGSFDPFEPLEMDALIEDLKHLCPEIAWDSANGRIIDIVLNGESIGYFAAKTLCAVYDLEQAPLLQYGEYEDLQEWYLPSLPVDEPISIIPLHGGFEVSECC